MKKANNDTESSIAEIDVKDIVDLSKEVNFNKEELVVGDPVVAYLGNPKVREVGKVTKVNIGEKDNVVMTVQFKSGLTQEFNDETIRNLDPLFFSKTKQYTQFSQKEVEYLLEKKAFAGLNVMDMVNQRKKIQSLMNSLRKGNWTDPISFEVTYTKKEENVKASFMSTNRFKMYLNKNKNKIGVWKSAPKAKSLQTDNIFKTPYGEITLTDSQMKQLNSRGNVGLVEAIDKNTGEVVKVYAAVDKGLNRLVARPEKSIFLNKVYSHELSEKEKNILNKGEGIVLDLKKNDKTPFSVYVEINPSTKNYTGIRQKGKDTAIKYGWLPEPKVKEAKGQAEESKKKTTKSKGVKI